MTSPEQRFTDEQIKELKEQAEREWENPVELSPTEAQALLARLEAAENAVKDEIKRGWDSELLQAWRQVAGK